MSIGPAAAQKNLGSVLLKVRQIDIRLQRVLPSGLDLDEIARSKFDVWPNDFPDKSKMYHETELQWPTLRLYRSTVKYEVEPGESDTVTTTFVVPCEVKQVRVASEVMKAEGMWWKARTFASTENACAPEKSETNRGAARTKRRGRL